MIIFKRLPLKVLSALQKHEGGGDGLIKIITQMFLSQTLHEYTSIHRRTATSVTHTLSPSLSLSLSHPHTHTHTHTHTAPHHTTHTFAQSKSGRYKLIRFLEVEEIGL